MKIPILEALAEGRAKLVANGKGTPYVAHVSKRRAGELRDELSSIGCYFGVPLFVDVPHHEEEGDWLYLGIVLADVHVFERRVAT